MNKIKIKQSTKGDNSSIDTGDILLGDKKTFKFKFCWGGFFAGVVASLLAAIIYNLFFK